MEGLSKVLQLNADQKSKVQPLLDQTNKDIKALQTDERTKGKAIYEKLHEQIKGILTPEQQKKLDEIHAKAEAHKKGKAEGAKAAPATPAAPGKAHPGPGGPGEHRHLNPDQIAADMAKNLGLSDDVKGKLKAIFEDSGKQAKAIFEDQSLDRAAKGAKLKALHEATEGKVKPLLTPEQQTKLEQWKAAHHHPGGPGGHQQPPAKP